MQRNLLGSTYKKEDNRAFSGYPFIQGESMAGQKHCRDCGEDRPVVEFTSDRSRLDGLSFYCKVHARRRLLASKDARLGPPRSRHRRDVAVPEGHKWCPECDEVKPVAEYPRNRSQPSGFAVYCKPCHNARGRASRDKVGGSRTYHLKRRYGITADDFDAMIAEQGGLCAVCVSAPAEHVDHDHATGAVRALLGFNCNGGLGQFRDDPTVLRAAARYVERHRGQPVAQSSPPSPLRRSRSSLDSARLETRRRAAGCRTDDVVRARVAFLMPQLGRSAGG